ncbi:MAG: HEAT repeat domain-containing protein [Planctomycetes bacterium]|nr:HEAT repeat domain-containing protein [Planctomycetota bacterium]
MGTEPADVDPARAADCASCKDLGAHEYSSTRNASADDALPPGFRRLAAIGRGGILRRCPRCNSYFSYRRAYDSDLGGYDEEAWLDRIGSAEARACLLASGDLSADLIEELRRLGVADALQGKLASQMAALQGDDKIARHHAVSSLLAHYLGQGRLAGVDELLAHPSPAVRRDVLYALFACGNHLIDRFGRMLADVDPGVRNYAAWGLRSAAEGGKDVSGEVARLAGVVGGDPDQDVRRQAAAVLAEAAARGVDISRALAPLISALTSSAWSTRSTAAAALGAAAARGCDVRSALPALEACLSDPDDTVRTRAAEALRRAGQEGTAGR